MKKDNCVICGKDISQEKGLKYCKKCANKAYKEQNVKKHGNRKQHFENKTCICGKSFKPNSEIHKFCSGRCRKYFQTIINKFKPDSDFPDIGKKLLDRITQEAMVFDEDVVLNMFEIGKDIYLKRAKIRKGEINESDYDKNIQRQW